METELLNTTAIVTAIAAVVGPLIALILMEGLKKLKAFVLRTPNKIDDAILAAVEKALKKKK